MRIDRMLNPTHTQHVPAVVAAVVTAVIASGVPCASAFGQSAGYSPAYLAGSAWDRLEPIDPGTADVGPLGLQTRVLPNQMHCDRDFSLLYRAFAPNGDPVFARREAGVTALFSRSAYFGTPSGDVAMIPPGTRFIIGEPAAAFSQSIGLLGEPVVFTDPSHGLRIDGRLRSRADDAWHSGSDAARADDPGATPRRGVAELLRRAARNERRATADQR